MTITHTDAAGKSLAITGRQILRMPTRALWSSAGFRGRQVIGSSRRTATLRGPANSCMSLGDTCSVRLRGRDEWRGIWDIILEIDS